MDPRIKARRIEVRRGQGRRRLQRLADVGAVVLVAAGFAVALRSPLLDVDRIVVTGAARTGGDAVLGELGIGRGDPLMDLDLAGAGARVAELPWVQEVSLHRRVDGVVEVAVIERTPVAVVPSAAGDLLVDASGRVLGPPASGGADLGPLPSVVGLAADLRPGDHLPSAAAGALQAAGALGAAAPGAVTELRADPDDLRATLATGGEVRLGTAERIDAKVRSLATMLEQVDLACLDELDLRLPGSPVLTREDACS
jgi:cell division protein FtsQ